MRWRIANKTDRGAIVGVVDILAAGDSGWDQVGDCVVFCFAGRYDRICNNPLASLSKTV